MQGLEPVHSVQCEYCEKILASAQTLNEHRRTCSVKMRLDKEMLEEEKFNALRQTYEQKLHHVEEMLREKEKQYQEVVQEKNTLLDALLREKDNHAEESKRLLEKRMDDLAEIAKQTKTRTTTTHTNNILIQMSPLDLNDTASIRAILKRHMDENVLADGQRGVARMLAEKMLTDENGSKKYRCTDANRGNFEYIDPHGHVERDPKGGKLREALVKSDIKEIAYNNGEHWWKRKDGSLDHARFDAISEKVKEVADIALDDSKLRAELSTLMS